MKKRFSRKTMGIIFVLIVVFLITGGIVVSFVRIYTEVKITCLKAQKEYKTDCVGSLIQILESDQTTMRERNTAIWALGQLADKQALSVLQRYYTGNRSSREPLDITISQYELNKAIGWCLNGNIMSWMYRNRDVWR